VKMVDEELAEMETKLHEMYMRVEALRDKSTESRRMRLLFKALRNHLDKAAMTAGQASKVSRSGM